MSPCKTDRLQRSLTPRRHTYKYRQVSELPPGYVWVSLTLALFHSHYRSFTLTLYLSLSHSLTLIPGIGIELFIYLEGRAQIAVLHSSYPIQTDYNQQAQIFR
jgi:hypothetical protein